MPENGIVAWLRGLPLWIKAMSVLVTVAVGLFIAGWNFNDLFSQQIGLPRTVTLAVERLGSLETRMVAAESQIAIVNQNTVRLQMLTLKVDSLVSVVTHNQELAIDTYCIVWAHGKNLDIGQECTLLRPPLKR